MWSTGCQKPNWTNPTVSTKRKMFGPQFGEQEDCTKDKEMGQEEGWFWMGDQTDYSIHLYRRQDLYSATIEQ